MKKIDMAFSYSYWLAGFDTKAIAGFLGRDESDVYNWLSAHRESIRNKAKANKNAALPVRRDGRASC